MKELLEEFEALCADRATKLVEEHSPTQKIVEYTGIYVPEELIYACGAKPYPMWRGGEPEPPDAILDEGIRFMNPLVRTQYGLMKLGLDPVAEEADMYATSQADCHAHRISELIERAGYPICKVGVPTAWTTELDFEYFTKKLADFKSRLEIITGNAITDERLREAIGLYNKIRGLLREIDEFRKLETPPISGTDFQRIDHCSMLCEPEQAIEMLARIRDCLADAQPEKAKRPRVVVFGHAIAQGDYVVMSALEKAGADIVHEVMDDACFRYAVDVDESAANPFMAIARHRYLDQLPNDNMQPSWGLRRETLAQAVRDYKADGVVWYDLLYDELYDMEYACMADYLAKKGIPLMRISTSYEYTREAMGPLNTRVETFVATLQGGKR